MTLTDIIAALDAGEMITGGSPEHAVMLETSQDALPFRDARRCPFRRASCPEAPHR